MKIIDRVPKKGEYFVYKANNIRKFVIDEQSQHYNYVLSDMYIDNEKLDDRYLLFIYLGDGLAREISSSTIFNLIMLNDYKEDNLLVKVPGYLNYSNEDYKNFYRGYKKVLRNPLLIKTSQYFKKKSIYEVDDEVKEILQKNNYKDLSKIISLLNSTAQYKLQTQFNQIINDDYAKAFKENIKYTLKKTLK